MSGVNVLLSVVAAKDLTDKLTTLLKAGGGAYAAETPVLESEPTGIFRLAANHPEQTVLAILYINNLTQGWETTLSQLSTHTNIAPLVLSDDTAAIQLARDNGVIMALGAGSLSSALLEDALEATLACHTLRQYQSRLQSMLDLANQRFHDMADQFADWLWETDANLVLTFSSSRKRPAQSATKGSSFTSSFLEEEKLRIEDDFAELIRNPRPFHERDYWSTDPYGARLCWSVSGVPVQDKNGNVVGFRGVAKDVSSAKTATDQLYHLVNNDALTGLYNRNRAYDEITRTLRTAKRENRTGALLVLDIDRFAMINHTHGHAVGDKLLIHIAQVLKDNIRTGDLLARMDGDQFAVLFRDLRAEDLPMRLERLQGTLMARPLQTEKGAISLTMSGGVATYPHDADEADTLLTCALEALQKAKQRGPGKIERYNAEEAGIENASQLEWVEFVNECLNEHQERMVLHYQPIVPLSPTLPDGIKEWPEFYEVLVRMVDRDGQLIAPARFLGTAEEFGIIPKIDKLVTTRAIEMLEFWHQNGRRIHLSVNLSAKSFDDKDFTEAVAQRFKKAGLPKGCLVFEITETAILRDLPAIRQFMEKMTALGASFALDDCGVGYSSLNTIRHLPLSYIKIDGSFIKNLHSGGDDRAFVKAMADVAKQKNIATVAEMVEHEAALKALREMGIDYAQGFFFAPPAADLPEPGTFASDRWHA